MEYSLPTFLELCLDPLLYDCGCDRGGCESTSSADIFDGQISGNLCPR